MIDVNNITILVGSCDQNEDTFQIFHHCMEKYWVHHPNIVYSTETIQNPYYKTICKNYDIRSWTRRIRETVSEINSKYIMFMCDDIFLRDYVEEDRIYDKLCLLNNGIAAIHMEKQFDARDTEFLNGTLMRNPYGKYQTAVCCGIWLKQSLIDVLSIADLDPWTFEYTNKTLGYRFLITKDGLLDWGYYDENNNKKWFGIRRGLWCKEMIPFLQKEGLVINFSKRGFYE